MHTSLIALIVSLAAVSLLPAHADACGVKLMTRTANVARRSAHPSTVHLVGVDEPESLRRALSRSGHEVVVLTSLSELRDRDAIVLTSDANLSQARRSVPDGIALAVADNTQSTLAAVEHSLERRAESRNN